MLASHCSSANSVPPSARVVGTSLFRGCQAAPDFRLMKDKAARKRTCGGHVFRGTCLGESGRRECRRSCVHSCHRSLSFYSCRSLEPGPGLHLTWVAGHA